MVSFSALKWHRHHPLASPALRTRPLGPFRVDFHARHWPAFAEVATVPVAIVLSPGLPAGAELPRRQGARRGRTARLALAGAATGVRDGGDRQRAGAGLTALRQRPAPVR